MIRQTFALYLTMSMFSLSYGQVGNDAHGKANDAARESAKVAEQLYNEGKYQDAAEKYKIALKMDNNLESAGVGLARSLLALEKADEALKAAIAGVGAHPDSAPLMTALGDIQFRLGEMGKSEQAYITALQIDPKQAQAYLGLARLYQSFSLNGHAYDAIKRAHELDPGDPKVQLMWLYTLPRRERWSALMSYLAAPHSETREDREALTHDLQYLQATLDQPPHVCRLVTDAADTETKLIRQRSGVALEVAVNDRHQLLLFDTGASGITISRKAAEKAKLVRISDVSFHGIGSKGDQTGYLALADRILIGSWEFRDCVVTVGDKKIMPDLDGLIGADVFASYLVDINLPKAKVKLSSLPPRPGESTTSTARSSGSASASSHPQGGALESAHQETFEVPKDRYVAPEMKDWTGFFHFDHLILVPAHLNESKPLLFLVDTGAETNLLSLKAARSVTKVSSNPWVDLAGVSGSVDKVYKADKVEIRVGRLHQNNWTVDVIDLSDLSQTTGTEVSGLLGFNLLWQLEIKLDYRDGLVDFIYPDARGASH